MVLPPNSFLPQGRADCPRHKKGNRARPVPPTDAFFPFDLLTAAEHRFSGIEPTRSP